MEKGTVIMVEINVVVARETVVTMVVEMQTMTVVEMKMVAVIVVMVATIKPRLDLENLASQSSFWGINDRHTNLFFPHLC